ncbi:MAG: arsenosugar biosynthesis radical SAM (seleno)protein ArsS [Chitinophagaceae bacterium]
MSKSLKAQDNPLANVQKQLSILNNSNNGDFSLVPFQQKLKENGLYPLRPTGISIFQVNIGKMCNQVCRHCHVDAGPDRKEIMTKATMLECLLALENNPELKTVDITGGAPEMNPDFRWFIEQITNLVRHVIVRCNLTIIVSNKKYHDLPGFYKSNNIEVVSSLPFYTKDRTNRQRGDGVFENSITTLQMLNAVGYGKTDTGLVLNLVYNPAGAFLPASQQSLESDFKYALKKQYDIEFNNLFAITNLPISRFLDYLLQSGNYQKYMQKLLDTYNNAAASNVMCRNTISVGWDGLLYDCDFNQMLEMKVGITSNHISQFNTTKLNNRDIIIGQHCYGCTAGAGSGCGGALA